jgi:hypothetical protein
LSALAAGATEFREYQLPSIGAPLRQGDILEAVDRSVSKWERRLLVLTADCDFANDKHQGRVTCVPILDSSDYLLEFQLPAIRAGYAKKPAAALQAASEKVGFTGVSRDRLTAWATEDSTPQILAALEISEAKAIEFAGYIDALRMLYAEYKSLNSGIEGFATAIEKSGLVKTRDEALARVKGDLRSRINSLPGDAVFLGAVGPADADGYFAYLRHIEQLWEADISVTPTRSAVTHRRLARLSDRFTDAVAQQFGMVFMSIGLPAIYEEGRRRHADALGEGID